MKAQPGLGLLVAEGFKCLGHTTVQFIIVRQRKTLNGSCKSAKRLSVAVSRLSLRNRLAHHKPAGPTNFSGFHQDEGQKLVQQAHKIHSYKVPNRSLGCSGKLKIALKTFCLLRYEYSHIYSGYQLFSFYKTIEA